MFKAREILIYIEIVVKQYSGALALIISNIIILKPKNFEIAWQ